MTVFDVKTIIPDQGDQLCDKINSAISSTYWSFKILITIFIFSRNERNVEKKGGRFRFLALRRPTRGPATSPRPTQPITSIGPSRRPPRINSSFGGDFENIQSFRVSGHKKKFHEKKNLIFFILFQQDLNKQALLDAPHEIFREPTSIHAQHERFVGQVENEFM